MLWVRFLHLLFAIALASSSWLQQVNTLFLLMVLALIVGSFPALRRLQRADDATFERSRKRWMMWPSILDLLCLITLVRMVWR